MTKQFRPEDLKHFRYVSWPELSRDGKLAAYVVKTSEEETGDHIPQVHILNLVTREADTLPMGTQMPTFVQDGRKLCYLSNESGEYQVWLRDLTDGTVRQLTTARHGVNWYALSDDGSKLTFEATLWPEEVEQGKQFWEMTPEEKAAWEEEMDWRPYYVTELVYKMDEWYGMRKGEFSHVGVMDIPTGKAELLGLSMEAVLPALSHDGKLVAFHGYPYHDANGCQTELFVWNLAEGTLTQLTTQGSSSDLPPVFTPDDKQVIGTGYGRGCMVLMPFACGLDGQMTWLMDEKDDAVTHGVNDMVLGRTANGGSRSYAQVSQDGRWLYFLGAKNGRTGICRLNLQEKTPAEAVRFGEEDLHAFCISGSGDILSVMATDREPGELYLNAQKLTDHNGWLREYPQGKLEEFWIRSRDGKVELQYFLLHPVHEEPGKLYPAVLDIKGGPTTMYGKGYWHEFHALSAAGFAVIYGNPRGSVGFGQSFCDGPVCWQMEPVNDLEDMLLDAISRGFIDEKHVGVTGGSYGGYMTNKLIGRTKHFAAAVTQRSLINPATSYGTGDMGFVSARGVPQNFSMLSYLEDRARGNLITYIDNFKIPLLILHAFRDYRCGFEQAEQLFIAMKDRNPEVPCRLVMFPEENHALTRTGKLHNQIRHLQEMVDWFTKYLTREEESHGETTA